MAIQTQHQALLQAENFPETTGPIEYRETHVSRLYFTDRHVYKIKKPVNLGFLDFSTLEARLFFCREEVRLNCRLCPGTYLGVAEIRRKGDQIHIGDKGEIMDYAVVMNRLPEERMLDRLIETGDPTLPGHMSSLARILVHFHKETDIVRINDRRSNLEVVRINWEENFRQSAPFAGGILTEKALKACREFVGDFLEEYQSLVLRREAEGFVRDGHGDLHAEHICLTEPVCIYDCIEFNRRFRVADTAADLAFLLMDLEFRRRRDLAAILLNRYLELSGDGEMLSLLPFYKSYRAFVRGKVEGILSEDRSAGENTRQEAARLSRRYFNQALAYLFPPTLIITCGLMGTGKTTVARELSELIGARYFCSDQIRKELAGLEASTRILDSYEQGIYSPEFTQRTYDRLLECTVSALKSGQTVIADASFIHRPRREAFRRAAAEAGVPFYILQMTLDPDILAHRLDRRENLGREISDGRRELLGDQKEHFDVPSENEGTIIIDTSRDLEYNLHWILPEMINRSGVRP